MLDKEGLPDVLQDAVAEMTPWSSPLDRLPATRGKPAHRLAKLFLEAWTPGVDAAPPDTPQEAEFLSWLGRDELFYQPELVARRLRKYSGSIHPWLEQELPAANDPRWASEWSCIRDCQWPNMQDLIHVCMDDSFAFDCLPRPLRFFYQLFLVAAAGDLPWAAYASFACTSSSALVENISAIVRCATGSSPAVEFMTSIEKFAEEAAELKAELECLIRLLEWLVGKWSFREVSKILADLKQKLAHLGDVTLTQLRQEVQATSEVFRCVDQFQDGHEMFNFLQYFMLLPRCGTVLQGHANHGSWRRNS